MSPPNGKMLAIVSIFLMCILTLLVIHPLINHGIPQYSKSLTTINREVPGFILKSEKTWYEPKLSLTVTQRFYWNKYVVLRVELAKNDTLALAVVVLEFFNCSDGDVYSRVDKKLPPERLKQFNELKNYIDSLWLKYGNNLLLKNIVVEGYVIPRRGLLPSEFIKLIEDLNLIGKVKDIDYTVYDTEGNFVMHGGRRICEGRDFYEEVKDMVGVAGEMMDVMNKSKPMGGLYIGSFVVKTTVNELMKINSLKDRIAFVYVPLDMLVWLVKQGYSIGEIRYTHILKALPMGMEP